MIIYLLSPEMPPYRHMKADSPLRPVPWALRHCRRCAEQVAGRFFLSRLHLSSMYNRFHKFDLIICLVLALSTVLVYWDIFSHQFVIIDDPVYVTQKPNSGIL